MKCVRDIDNFIIGWRIDMDYICHYDIAAIIVLLVLAIHFYSKKTIITDATKVFMVLMNIFILLICVHLIIHRCICSASFQQFLVFSAFNNLTMFEHHDSVTILP